MTTIVKKKDLCIRWKQENTSLYTITGWLCPYENERTSWYHLIPQYQPLQCMIRHNKTAWWQPDTVKTMSSLETALITIGWLCTWEYERTSWYHNINPYNAWSDITRQPGDNPTRSKQCHHLKLLLLQPGDYVPGKTEEQTDTTISTLTMHDQT